MMNDDEEGGDVRRTSLGPRSPLSRWPSLGPCPRSKVQGPLAQGPLGLGLGPLGLWDSPLIR
eukprot:9188954-Pyramimonas_sp.AAC.1